MKLGEYESGPCIELREEAWREIEATLRLKSPNNEVRKSVALHVSRHLLWAEMGFPKQRIPAQKKWIGRVQKKTQQLIDILDWEASEDENDDGYNQMYAVYDLLPREEQRSLLASLKVLRAKAENMLARLSKGKSGPDPDDFLWGLVFDLAFAYEQATNKRPTITYNPYGHPDADYTEDGDVAIYEGPFLDFVAAILRVFAPDRAKGNKALGKHIARVLKVWRRQRGIKDKTPA